MKFHRIPYSRKYEVDIGSHVFPVLKYRLVKEKLEEICGTSLLTFIEPEPACENDIAKVHTVKYVSDIRNGTLSFADELRLELPYSAPLAEASFICCSGTLDAARIALETGTGFHIGGGFHHAYPDHGEGFCVFNDAAYAARVISEEGYNVLIADCDVHQGNGTAVIFSEDNKVFTFSMHQDNNYPLKKEKSDLDIGLPDGISGREYNSILEKALLKIRKIFTPDLIIYIAGADPYSGDRLGGLNLSLEDLRNRDLIIKEFSKGLCPAAVTLAGGYSLDPLDTVRIHLASACAFLEIPYEDF